MHEKLIDRRCCFYIDGIQKCAAAFKLKIFNLHMFNRTLDVKCYVVCSHFVLFGIIRIIIMRAFIAYVLDLSSLRYMLILPISCFGDSTAILNLVDIFRRWCKLSFRPMQGQVKSRHFSEKIGARRPYFNFSYKFLEIISQKQLGQLFWKPSYIYCYLLNGIGLDLDLHNIGLVQKVPN